MSELVRGGAGWATGRDWAGMSKSNSRTDGTGDATTDSVGVGGAEEYEWRRSTKAVETSVAVAGTRFSDNAHDDIGHPILAFDQKYAEKGT